MTETLTPQREDVPLDALVRETRLRDALMLLREKYDDLLTGHLIQAAIIDYAHELLLSGRMGEAVDTLGRAARTKEEG